MSPTPTSTGRRSLNAPSGAGCSLTLPLGAAWLQRFQGLDRHRPSGALPGGGWNTPFLPPFVGMTPLATDGPGGGSGAGFGRDHAEKWQSGGVSSTTLMVTNVTDSVSLSPASTRPTPPLLIGLLGGSPSSSTSTAPPTPVPHRRRIFPYPTRQRAESHSLPNRTQDRDGPRH